MSGATTPLRILITGSNSGFGRLATLTLARQGHHIIATMRRGVTHIELPHLEPRTGRPHLPAYAST